MSTETTRRRARSVAMLRGHTRRRVLALGLLLAGVVLAVCPCAFALDPALDVSQYAHTAWRTSEGFPNARVTAFAQTSDGYLWIGTDLGLVRYDGVKAVPWQPPGQPLPDTFIRSLLVARDGTLWIGTLKGLASWKDGKLTPYKELAGLSVEDLLEDRQGTLWVGALGFPNGKLCAIQGGAVACNGQDGGFGGWVDSLYEDRVGNLWAAAATGLWRWKPGPPKLYPIPHLTGTHRTLVENDDGALLIASHGGIRQLVNGRIESYSVPGRRRFPPADLLLLDHDGGLWIGTGAQGLVHVHQGKADVFTKADGLSGDSVLCLFEDREGNVWVATNDGLDRFRRLPVTTLDSSPGFSHRFSDAVLADRDGSIWIANPDGLNRLSNGRFVPVRIAGRRPDGKTGAFRPIALFQDDRGRMWVSTPDAFGYLEKDQFVPLNGFPADAAVRSIAQDNAGNIWVAYNHSAVFRVSRSDEVERIPVTKLGHEDIATALASDPLRGGLWVGFFNGGLVYFQDGEVRASYTAADGLGQGFVADIRITPDGTLWASTQGGLSRLKNGRIAALSNKNGLPCDTVHWSREDDTGSVWLYTACGLVHFPRSELDRWAAVDADKNSKQGVRAAVLTDGVHNEAYAVGFSPIVAKSSDGKFWFVVPGGVSVFDPSHLSFNPLPPPVQVEQIIVDHNVSWQNSSGDASASVRLPPQVRDLEIDYTALSFVEAEKVHFRYKLEGWDPEWQWVGNRRQAFYTNLSPGDYRFRVAASNNSGVWNEAGTSLDFSIAPAYYQTTWFRLSCVAAFMALLWGLYQLRLRQAMHSVQHRMEGRLMERERIARELHDTLLQSVQGLILKFDAVAKQIPRDEPARLSMDAALDRADEVMGEGRERVRSLRSGVSALSDLPAAFQRVADETAPGREATFKTIVEGSVRELNPMVLEESYSIGREALINALAHSGGLHVEVEIMYDPRQFRLRVRDDGRGVDPRILENGGRPGHWGMQGMRERAQGMGAQLGLWSRPGNGTEVELLVPAATAYRSGRTPTKTSWLGRHSGNGR